MLAHKVVVDVVCGVVVKRASEVIGASTPSGIDFGSVQIYTNRDIKKYIKSLIEISL